MDKKRRKALEADGWKFGTVQEALGLTDQESAVIEMKLALSDAIRASRERKKVTQAQLAKLMRTSQPRVATLETGEATLDLLVRALLALGSTPRQIGNKMAGNSKRRPVKAA
jgi:DNA-binding transcriptional regulator YiaG